MSKTDKGEPLTMLIWLLKKKWNEDLGNPTQQTKHLRMIKALLFDRDPVGAIREAVILETQHDNA